MFAVIKTGGKQYRVAANDLLKIEKVAGNPGDIIEFACAGRGDGDQATFGAPFVDGAIVTAEVVEQGRMRPSSPSRSAAARIRAARAAIASTRPRCGSTRS